MKKRGLSGVVSALILILLVLVGIGIVWFVVSNFLDEGTEDVNIGRLKVETKPVSAKLLEGGSKIAVTVKREGSGDMDGLRFILEDKLGNRDIVEKDAFIGQEEAQVFDVNVDELTDFTDLVSVEKVYVQPRIDSNYGIESKGKEVEDRTLVFYLPLEEDFQDKINGYEGSCDEANNRCPELAGVEGVMATRFNTVQHDYLDYGADIEPNNIGTNQVTLSAWIYFEDFYHHTDTTARYSAIISNTLYNSGGGKGYNLDIDGEAGSPTLLVTYGNEENPSIAKLDFEVHDGTRGQVQSTEDIPFKEWVHVVGTFNSTIKKVYIGGVKKGQSYGGKLASSSNRNLLVGTYSHQFPTYYSYGGYMRNVRIYDRALSEEEVEGLYNSEKGIFGL